MRARLFLSLLPFVVILLAMGIYATVLFSGLANRMDASVTANYRAIVAAQSMSEALDGLEHELRAASLTQNRDQAALDSWQIRFQTNLLQQLKAADSPRDRELLEKLADEFGEFQRGLGNTRVLRTPKDRRRTQAFPYQIASMNGLLAKIRAQNYESVLATTRNVQRTTSKATRLMILGTIIVLITATFTCFQLSRSILRPIRALTRATRQLGEGNPHQRVPIVSRDELGELGLAFNAMAAQLEDYRRNTSEEIIRLHRTMETTLASFPDPIFVLNKDGEIELKNPAAEQLAGMFRWNSHLPERLQAIARRTLETGMNFLPNSFNEVISYRWGETEKFYLPRVLAMRDKEDALFGVAVVLYDVTRFRLLDAAKSNLVATVSHELNTPLTSVRMALHLLLEKNLGALTAKQDALLQTARNDTERLLRIFNDLMDMARLEAGNAELRRERAFPAELLQTAIEETSERVAANGLKLACIVSPELPPVLVDRQRIGHVFTNLISNAIKYSPPGGEITLQAEAAEDHSVEFSISDEGPGIPEEYQSRIFDRFYRVPGQTKTGAGLGLSITREIVVAHGGCIKVKSSPGHGAMFCVILKADGY